MNSSLLINLSCLFDNVIYVGDSFSRKSKDLSPDYPRDDLGKFGPKFSLSGFYMTAVINIYTEFCNYYPKPKT